MQTRYSIKYLDGSQGAFRMEYVHPEPERVLHNGKLLERRHEQKNSPGCGSHNGFWVSWYEEIEGGDWT